MTNEERTVEWKRYDAEMKFYVNFCHLWKKKREFHRNSYLSWNLDWRKFSSILFPMLMIIPDMSG